MALTKEDLQAIGQLLKPMEEKLDKVGYRLDKVEQKLDKVEQRLDKVEQRLDKVETDVVDIKLTLENVTNRSIMIVAEGHLDLVRKLDNALKIEQEKEIMAIRMNLLEDEVRRVKDKLVSGL